MTGIKLLQQRPKWGGGGGTDLKGPSPNETILWGTTQTHLVTDQIPLLLIVILAEKFHLVRRQVHGILQRKKREGQRKSQPCRATRSMCRNRHLCRGRLGPNLSAHLRTNGNQDNVTCNACSLVPGRCPLGKSSSSPRALCPQGKLRCPPISSISPLLPCGNLPPRKGITYLQW